MTILQAEGSERAQMIPVGPSLLGITMGMRHALEPDHLAAVSTLTSEQRSPSAGLALGAMWGVGHSLSLFILGGTLSVLEQQLPKNVENLLEVLVALMVIALGVRALLKAWAEGRTGVVHEHTHGHDSVPHSHSAPVEHLHVNRVTLATRPLLIGLVHGLAGSGALTFAVLSELHTTAERLSYILLFGGGSILGMGVLTGLLGVPLSRAAKHPRFATALLGVAGVVSLGIGLWWGAHSVARLLGVELA